MQMGQWAFFQIINRVIAISAMTAIVAGCSTLTGTGKEINCALAESSCHSGRFGLVFKVTQPDGSQEGDSVSGTYEWRSLSMPSRQIELAYLEVSSLLGPSLGTAQQRGDFFEVRAADGRVYLAQDWQTLFDLMFPVKLPADALVNWMKNPRPDNLPPLPENWTWENRDSKYRIRFVETNAEGRIDLIPLDGQ